MSDPVNLKEKFALFNKCWTPKIVGELDHFYVKIFKAKGEFSWHLHEEGDEFFLVIRGQLTVKLRDNEVTLRENEFFIIPKGVEHCPYAKDEAHVLLIEGKALVNTGTGTEALVELERL